MERFLDYWRLSDYLQQLHNLLPASVQLILKIISPAECKSGKLIAPFAKIQENTLMAVVPFYAIQGTKYFFPCILLVELNAQGDFVAMPHLSLPIIPYSVLEPSSLCPITLGSAEKFANYMAINPAPWLDEPTSLTWSAQLNYATTMLTELVPNWCSDVVKFGFKIAEHALLFPVSSLPASLPTDINFNLLERPNNITINLAERNVDTSAHARRLIIDAWIKAAVKQADPPLYVWLKGNSTATYANIFECMGANSVVQNSEDVYSSLLAAHEDYVLGLQVLRNWQEVSARVHDKYTDKGGINTRIEQLQSSLREAKVQSRHVEVLQAIWNRQKELLSAWPKFFDFIPSMQKQRLQRLHAFFKQNFPNENVTGFTESDFDDLINEKFRRAENNERMIGDTLHQVENDMYQETLVRDKCLQWCREHDLHNPEPDTIKVSLENSIWMHLARLALLYWQQDFTAKQGYGNFLNIKPSTIELLIVEHAEYVTPIVALPWLAKAKKAIIMGNYNPICAPRFAVAIDYELTKHFGLVENDADFEDLQFEGVLTSVGNLWNMVAKEREADQILENTCTKNLQYQFVDVPGDCIEYVGSYINVAVVEPLLNWLNQHASLRDEVAIYTCFAGQAQILTAALQATQFARVPVRAIQQPCFAASKISIFIPVYTSAIPGPYVFDHGLEILGQLTANTQDQVVIIGDRSIFKPELHSAAGQFAQKIFASAEQQEIMITEEEANCV